MMYGNRYSMMWTNTKNWKHDKEMVQKVREFQEQNILCDLTLCSDGFQVDVHKIVLAAVSDYFKVMLTSNMLESRQRVIELKALTSVGLSAVVEFAYNGAVNLSMGNLADVLGAASHCLMMELVSKCTSFMSTIPLTCDNCVTLLNLANMYSVNLVSQTARSFFYRNYKEIYEKKLFTNLSVDNLYIILTGSLTMIQAPREMDLFKLLIDWVHCSSEREEYLSKLMQNIKFPLMSMEELESPQVVTEIQKCSREIKRYMIEAKKYHKNVERQPQFQMKSKPDYELRSSVPTLVTCNGTDLRYIDITSGETGCLRDLPCNVYDASICCVNNFLYVCGGATNVDLSLDVDPSGVSSRCFWYNPRVDVWCQMKPMKQARKHFALVALNDGFYAIGGCKDDGEAMVSVENFSVLKNRWCPSTHLPFALQRHAGQQLQGNLYVSGGMRNGTCNSSSNLMCLDVSQRNSSWTQKARMMYDRRDHTMVQMSAKLYVVGGIKTYEFNKDGPNRCIEDYQQIESYDPEVDQWTMCKKLMPPSLTSVAAVVCQGHLFTMGNVKTVIPEVWWTYIRKIEPLNSIGAAAIHECFIYRGHDLGKKLRDVSRHNCGLLELPQDMHGRRVTAAEPFVVKRKRDVCSASNSDYHFFTAPGYPGAMGRKKMLD
ncbi:kelch-like protein 15 [Lineus longissimus]|uniref:kelch-like protein 15 n=1 Tax=Lineus longissimus TaxID=88925 RepID=UPI00315D7614